MPEGLSKDALRGVWNSLSKLLQSQSLRRILSSLMHGECVGLKKLGSAESETSKVLLLSSQMLKMQAC